MDGRKISRAPRNDKSKICARVEYSCIGLKIDSSELVNRKSVKIEWAIPLLIKQCLNENPEVSFRGSEKYVDYQRVNI